MKQAKDPGTGKAQLLLVVAYACFTWHECGTMELSICTELIRPSSILRMLQQFSLLKLLFVIRHRVDYLAKVASGTMFIIVDILPSQMDHEVSL